MTIQEKHETLVNDFKGLADWETKYRRIIEFGKKMPAFPEELKTEDNKVRGCQSQVWMSATLDGDRVHLAADSDAAIVKGLIAILVHVYSGEKPSDILTHPPTFLNELGLNSNLSQARVNGLASMAKQIMFYAMAFQSLVKS